MRVLAFEHEPGATGTDAIRAFARIDVVTHPALGCGRGKLMAARVGTLGAEARPFSGARLEHAVWNPSPPDILVSATSETRRAVPGDIRRELPWILIFAAWRRLQPVVPSMMMTICWQHGEDESMPVVNPSRPEREAWFVAMALHVLLHQAAPDELVALSRGHD